MGWRSKEINAGARTGKQIQAGILGCENVIATERQVVETGLNAVDDIEAVEAIRFDAHATGQRRSGFL